MLQFVLADGSKISARPSGTEPKIKFYFSVRSALIDRASFDGAWKALGERIDAIIRDLNP